MRLAVVKVLCNGRHCHASAGLVINHEASAGMTINFNIANLPIALWQV